jgi:hypothetical protein
MISRLVFSFPSTIDLLEIYVALTAAVGKTSSLYISSFEMLLKQWKLLRDLGRYRRAHEVIPFRPAL